MKILYGMQPPDEGTILVDGVRAALQVAAATPSPSASAWCTSTSCWPTTSPCCENIVLGDEPRHRRAASTSARRRERILELGRDLRPRRRPRRAGRDLGVGERQRVEILKVLYRGARILILDEPTAVLVPQEVDELFDHLARARRPRASRSSSSPTSSTRCSRSPTPSPSSAPAAPSADVLPRGRDRPATRRADGRQRAARRPRPASRPSPTRSRSRSTA